MTAPLSPNYLWISTPGLGAQSLAAQNGTISTADPYKIAKANSHFQRGSSGSFAFICSFLGAFQ